MTVPSNPTNGAVEPDGGEHRQARLHAADDGVRGALQRLGDPLAGADGARQARLVGLVIFIGLLAGLGERAKRIRRALQLC
jgi:hypothetical protein